MKKHSLPYAQDIQQEEKNKLDAEAKDEYYSKKLVDCTLRLSITYNTNETNSKTSDLSVYSTNNNASMDEVFDWFKNELLLNVKAITEVGINFSGRSGDEHENISLNFSEKSVYYNSTTRNMDGNYLVQVIENYFNSLPPRYDTLVDKDTRRTMIPSLSISIPLGLIISFVLLILGRVNVISESVAKYLTSGIVLTAIFLLIAFLGSLLIPTKNTELYKNIKFNTYYAGHDKNWKNVYKTDYAEYKNQCEIAIGINSNMPNVRTEIEKNYMRSKKIVLVELIISIICIILFFVF